MRLMYGLPDCIFDDFGTRCILMNGVTCSKSPFKSKAKPPNGLSDFMILRLSESRAYISATSDEMMNEVF